MVSSPCMPNLFKKFPDSIYKILGVRGASGIWRIKDRTVTFTQRIGDEKIMEEH